MYWVGLVVCVVSCTVACIFLFLFFFLLLLLSLLLFACVCVYLVYDLIINIYSGGWSTHTLRGSSILTVSETWSSQWMGGHVERCVQVFNMTTFHSMIEAHLQNSAISRCTWACTFHFLCATLYPVQSVSPKQLTDPARCRSVLNEMQIAVKIAATSICHFYCRGCISSWDDWDGSTGWRRYTVPR